MLPTEPKESLWFHIRPKHVKKAVRMNPCNCVVAMGLMEIPGLVRASVFPTITLLSYADGRDERYATSPVLRAALDRWDKGGDWELPAKSYELKPVSYSQRNSQAPRNVISNNVRNIERWVRKGLTKTQAMGKLKVSKRLAQLISDKVGKIRVTKGGYVTMTRVLSLRGTAIRSGRKPRRGPINPRFMSLKALQREAAHR